MLDPRIFMYPGRDLRDYPAHPTVEPYDIEVVLERRYRNAAFQHDLFLRVSHFWQQLTTLEHVLQNRLATFAHAHPRPAMIHLRRRR